MATPAIQTAQSSLSPDTISRLATALNGDLIQPHDPDYDDARTLYNAMIDKRPALIARCANVDDVITTVTFARDHQLDLAVRGGGHNGPGLGSVDGGLVLDLSTMMDIRVDAAARTARVEGGATWADVDRATHPFGLAVPSGTIASTGVGGLTLGGGIGHLSRKFGLTIDNLLEADVILANGRLVTASTDEHPDLFWALRGGGGNFGVVTAFTFRLHPVDSVVAGPTLWPIDQAEVVLRWYRDFINEAPSDLSGFFAFLTVPPAPGFPEELHGQTMCGVVWTWLGDPERVDDVFAPVLEVGTPSLHAVQAMPFPDWQSAFDGLYPPGHQWYWKGDFVRDLPDAAITRHLQFGSNLPSPQSTMHLYPINGAVHRVGERDTAFNYRDVTWAEVIVGVDPDPAKTETISTWARDYWEALHPYAAGGAYVNFMMEEGQERVRATYRANYDRLAQVKATYDPANLFHVNQNIRPITDTSTR